MTNEEAIARIRVHMIVHKMNEPRAIYISEALEMAIKALEQESCENCISRNLCDSCTNNGCIFQSGIVRNYCDFYKAESEDKE